MKRINGEPVKLVESEDELNTPGIFYYAPCGKAHRFMPMSPTKDGAQCCWMAGHQAYEMMPAASCTPPRFGGHSYTCTCSIDDDRVYRVVDEVLDSTTTTSHATRELERAR